MKFSRSLASVLPLSLQQGLRRIHYSRKLSSALIGDEEDLSVLPRFVAPGMTVLDIGANFGLYTRFLSEIAGETGKVYAFEPVTDTHEVLANNVSSLGLKNVITLQLALSDERGMAEIRIPQRPDGSLNHYESSLESAQIQGEFQIDRVPMETLDGVCSKQGIEHIDFIKCDVEGHEISVLEGGRNILTECRPVILLEVNEPLCGDPHGEAVRAWFEKEDYAIFVMAGEELRPWEEGIVQVNYVFVPREKSESLMGFAPTGSATDAR